MNMKKAISPLIATVLLIVVAVALIAIVLSWGKSFTTSGLSETGNVVDTTCTGATLTISSCTVDSSSNLVFYVTNNSSTYDFATTDDFTFDVTSDTGTFSGDNNMSASTSSTWAGLNSGETVKVSKSLSSMSVSGSYYDVTVKSSVCTSDAVYTFKNCHS